MTAAVITGTGAICAAGGDVEGLWTAMERADARPVPVDDPDARMSIPLIYPVTRQVRTGTSAGPHAGRTTGLLATAAAEALVTAGLAPDPTAHVVPSRFGVVVGTGMGDSGEHEARRAGRAGSGTAADRPVFAVAGNLARTVGARGPVISVSNACAASAYAIGEALDLLESGECDVVLACGAESYSRVALGCFNRMGAIDTERCRPFAADRGGTMFGEGAAVLVLETARHAAARGATPLARLLGAAFSCDADHPTAPSTDGQQATRALRAALTDAGVDPGDVVAVLPHGTGTEQNDVVEASVLASVLGARAGDVPLYSLKALIGHTGGAAGALAAVAAVELVRRRRLPGNVDVGPQDPALDVVLPAAGTDLAPGPVLVNAYAFGGNNASLVLAGAS